MTIVLMLAAGVGGGLSTAFGSSLSGLEGDEVEGTLPGTAAGSGAQPVARLPRLRSNPMPCYPAT